MKVPGLPDGALVNYHWLTSDAALPYLNRCSEHTGELTRLVSSLRKELSAERAHLVIEQAELRARGQVKFTRASEMFFTRKGLEQATDEAIAWFKAQRIVQTAGISADICCGIGGDLLALAKQGARVGVEVLGVDADPITAHFASTNLRLIGSNSCHVQAIRAEEIDPLSLAVWHIDPDRRLEGKRTSQLSSGGPGREIIDAWLEKRPRGALKLAPAAVIEPPFSVHVEQQWIGSRGECRQLMVWFGDLATHHRTATVVEGDEFRTVRDSPAQMAAAPEPLAYVFESHAAVLAADVAPSLAVEQGLLALTPGDGGYLTGESPITDDLALSCFRVRDVLPFDLRRLRSYFREHRIGILEIKKRGIQETPEQIRKSLALHGDQQACLLIARVAMRKTIAIISHRMAPTRNFSEVPTVPG